MTSIAQRQELQAKIWKIANDVRGSVDGWDFKQFVLGARCSIASLVKILPITLKVVMKALTMRHYPDKVHYTRNKRRCDKNKRLLHLSKSTFL
jgi:hypothetical protein